MHVSAIWKDFPGKMNLSGKKNKTKQNGAVCENKQFDIIETE